MKSGDEAFLQQVVHLEQEIEAGGALSDLRNPGTFPEALDVSVAEWLDVKKIGPLGRAVMEVYVMASYGQPSTEVGIHFALDQIKGAGGWVAVTTDGPEGGQYQKIKEG